MAESTEKQSRSLCPDRALTVDAFDRHVSEVARALLGCVIVALRDGDLVAGEIVETEAYGGEDDPASHAAFRRSGVVRAMYGPAGTAYVYKAYGVYPCLNVVTGEVGDPSAVLIRAITPVHNAERMAARVGKPTGPRIASGPGLSGLALGVTVDDNGHLLTGPPLWIQPGTIPDKIVVGPRVGITREIDRPWRFGIAGHPALSRRFPG